MARNLSLREPPERAARTVVVVVTEPSSSHLPDIRKVFDQFSFMHSSQKRPLKPSQVSFCMGRPPG